MGKSDKELTAEIVISYIQGHSNATKTNSMFGIDELEAIIQRVYSTLHTL